MYHPLALLPESSWLGEKWKWMQATESHLALGEFQVSSWFIDHDWCKHHFWNWQKWFCDPGRARDMDPRLPKKFLPFAVDVSFWVAGKDGKMTMIFWVQWLGRCIDHYSKLGISTTSSAARVIMVRGEVKMHASHWKSSCTCWVPSFKLIHWSWLVWAPQL